MVPQGYQSYLIRINKLLNSYSGVWKQILSLVYKLNFIRKIVYHQFEYFNEIYHEMCITQCSKRLRRRFPRSNFTKIFNKRNFKCYKRIIYLSKRATETKNWKTKKKGWRKRNPKRHKNKSKSLIFRGRATKKPRHKFALI